jgi:hypothetical protein
MTPNDNTENFKIHDNTDDHFDDSDLETYQGDFFPEHIPDSVRQRLIKRYAALPEMFYTRTRRTVVRPDNVRSWLKNQKGKGRYHL